MVASVTWTVFHSVWLSALLVGWVLVKTLVPSLATQFPQPAQVRSTGGGGGGGGGGGQTPLRGVTGTDMRR